MATPLALRLPVRLRLLTGLFLAGWVLVALFPLVWVALMSFKQPVDAFAANPLRVLLGPATLAANGGLSPADLLLGIVALVLGYNAVAMATPRLARAVSRPRPGALAWLAGAPASTLVALLALVFVLPVLLRAADAGLRAVPGLAWFGRPFIGFTGEHYRSVWIGHAFYRNFENSLIVTAGVVLVSLSVGTLAGYALARVRSGLGFSLLMVSLVFRALPYSVLAAGYLPVFIGSRQLLAPLWAAPMLGPLLHLVSAAPPTLYGQPWAVIAVLVSINQPFTIWMLRSFFANIPAELDEAARVDGCSHFQAFRRVIMPVMWPGVITTGLFSFLLAYNDYLICALLLDSQSQTMVPAITQYFNRETTTTDQVEAIAAAVSITAPLFLLVMAFQRQIVSGLTAGAVKG